MGPAVLLYFQNYKNQSKLTWSFLRISEDICKIFSIFSSGNKNWKLTESIINPKYWICWEGKSINFSELIWNPKSYSVFIKSSAFDLQLFISKNHLYNKNNKSPYSSSMKSMKFHYFCKNSWSTLQTKRKTSKFI